MEKMPVIATARLKLRPFSLEDAVAVKEMAGDRDIARTTLNIPHPYEDGMAEEWISKHQEEYEKGTALTLAVTHKELQYLIGAVGIGINKMYERAELGYWIGKKYWNNGYCTEAAAGIINYVFAEMNLNRIYASHLRENPASGAVMKNIGMKYEGLFREHVKKWGEFKDLEFYSILKKDL